uniref:Uncharacterized protein n=1 Tax=Arundo donax TaxID=35708 RepID=A0A0A9AFU0_ARUDO
MHGLRTARDLGTGHIQLETNALMVQQAVTSTEYDHSMVGRLIVELKNLLRHGFISDTISFKPRV